MFTHKRDATFKIRETNSYIHTLVFPLHAQNFCTELNFII